MRKQSERVSNLLKVTQSWGLNPSSLRPKPSTLPPHLSDGEASAQHLNMVGLSAPSSVIAMNTVFLPLHNNGT